jgi:DNA-binding PucR family transcriptional regulator
VDWTDAARSAERALAACRLAVRGRLFRGGLVVAEEHAADLILHGDEELLAELADRRLGPLDALPPRVSARLSQTLLAWLEHRGRLREVADALFVHPQTVRYRVGQLRDALGDMLDDPRARFELELALRGRRDAEAGLLSESGSAGAGAG